MATVKKRDNECWQSVEKLEPADTGILHGEASLENNVTYGPILETRVHSSTVSNSQTVETTHMFCT